ncbi:MAG TPA: signal recognition particle subunit SRP19/SEC65 family protein [Thermoplasmata archaeon]|nr:signal recognition particle subunit SRP19/SEC65 family protein [Thermoplasmata archaeon]
MADHFYVYPSYLTSDATRSLGRRVPNATAVGPVTVDDIVAAARALGFTVEPEPEKQYPRRAHRYEGRVKVHKQPGSTKTTFLRRLAEELLKTHPVHRKS